jgi:hypothetical protein
VILLGSKQAELIPRLGDFRCHALQKLRSFATGFTGF